MPNIRDRHFGKEIIAENLELARDDAKVNTLWLKLYKVLHCV